MTEYVCSKKKFEKKEIEKVYIFFKNGDFLKIRKNEIMDIDVRLYDNLVWNGEESSPVVESGFIKLRIQAGKAKGEPRFLCDPDQYNKNRKGYIENRLTVEGGIERICLFNENNWHDTLFGDAFAVMEGDCLLIKYKPNDLYGPCTGENHVMRLGDVSRQNTERILLDFENCESFEIFPEEIINVQLKFGQELDWNSSGYAREIKGGFIQLRLSPKISWRKVNLADEWMGRKTRGIAPLEKRLCRKGEDVIDICHLYVTYDYAGYGIKREEHIAIHDIRPAEYFERLEREDIYDESFISGYARKQDDGTIMIVFGEALPQ